MGVRVVVTGKNEGQERASCLSCVLPECIPDHPLCKVPQPHVTKHPPYGIPLCAWCEHATLILTHDHAVPFYFKCSTTGDNTAGWHTTCCHCAPFTDLSDYARRKAADEVFDATRYYEVHSVQR